MIRIHSSAGRSVAAYGELQAMMMLKDLDESRTFADLGLRICTRRRSSFELRVAVLQMADMCAYGGQGKRVTVIFTYIVGVNDQHTIYSTDVLLYE